MVYENTCCGNVAYLHTRVYLILIPIVEFIILQHVTVKSNDEYVLVVERKSPPPTSQ